VKVATLHPAGKLVTVLVGGLATKEAVLGDLTITIPEPPAPVGAPPPPPPPPVLVVPGCPGAFGYVAFPPPPIPPCPK
jgi:hypothetical protein